MDTTAQKARLISLGIFHEGLDGLMEIFDLPVLKQRVRDVDRARERMYNVQDVVSVALDDLKAYLMDARKREKELNTDITSLIGDDDDNNDKDAELLQVQLDALVDEIAKREDRQKMKKAEFDQNAGAIQYLTSLFEQGSARIRELEEAKSETAHLHQTADAIEGVKEVISDSQGFGSMGSKIMEKNRVAQKRYERVTGSISSAMDNDEKVASARAKIAARKAALKDTASA